MTFSLRSAVLTAALVLSACADLTGPLHKPAPPPPDPHTQMAALESRIYDLVEAERIKTNAGAKPLRMDSELVGVAREKSGDMAAKNYLLHKAPDGETTADIIMNKDADFQGLLGENIAAEGYQAKYGIDVDTYARIIVKEWLDGADHQQNLSDVRFDRTGIGAAVSGDTVYVTQLFASDLGLPPPGQQHAAPQPQTGSQKAGKAKTVHPAPKPVQ